MALSKHDGDVVVFLLSDFSKTNLFRDYKEQTTLIKAKDGVRAEVLEMLITKKDSNSFSMRD